MKISVIIPCFNDADTIGAQLDALSQQSWPGQWEVIVSDNGSTDESMKVVEGYRQKLQNLTVVDSSDRQGSSHARNVAAEIATGEVLLFCDANDIVAPNWLETLGRAVAEHDFAACRLDTEKLNKPWQYKSWHNSQRDGLIKFNPPYLPFAGAGTLGVKRVIHEKVNGFDESVMKLVDVDYCWRIQLLGTKLHFVKDTAIYYRYPKKISSGFKQMFHIGENTVMLYKKYKINGMPDIPQPFKSGILAWVRFIMKLPALRSKAGFALVIRQLGLRLGRLFGSIKYRVLAL